MKFRPLHDRVVIRRLEGEEKTKGGIIIPDTVKEKPQEGEVVAVGPGARDEGGRREESDGRLRRLHRETTQLPRALRRHRSTAVDKNPAQRDLT